jgi:hypothetical protein
MVLIVYVQHTWNLRIFSIILILDQRQKTLTEVIYFQVRRSLTKPDHVFSGKTILTKPDQIQKFEYPKCLGLYLFIKLPKKWFACASEILSPSLQCSVEMVSKHYRKIPKIVKTELSYGPGRGHKNCTIHYIILERLYSFCSSSIFIVQ